MKIFCKSATTANVATNQKVNTIGKYLYNHIDGAFKYTKSSNTFDVYLTLLYQLANDGSGYIDDVHEITVNLSLTTYQGKIRVNVIEMTPMQRTLGYDLYPPEKLQNLDTAMHLIYNKVIQRISKAYKSYDILF